MGKKRNYCNNIDLTATIVKWQKSCRTAHRKKIDPPSIPHYVGECIYQICNRLTKGFKFDFSAYTYRDEMVADAIERCCYACYKFDATKSTAGAFSYLTTVAINAMKKRINDEKKQNYILHKNFQSLFVLGDVEGQSPNEMSDKVVEDFEAKIQRKAENVQSKVLTSKKKKTKSKMKIKSKKK